MGRLTQRGALYDAAVEQLSVAMGARGGANNPDNATQWVQYLQSVLQQQCSPVAAAVQQREPVASSADLAVTGL